MSVGRPPSGDLASSFSQTTLKTCEHNKSFTSLLSTRAHLLIMVHGSTSNINMVQLIHRSFFTFFLIFIQVFAACAAASIAEKYGDMALCPFDVRVDEDPSRIPKEIKQHTCRKSMSRNEGSGGDSDDMGMPTCADIGGHCVQVHETIKVSYRHRTLNHRKHDVRVNMSCVCIPLRGKPATPIIPNITRR